MTLSSIYGALRPASGASTTDVFTLDEGRVTISMPSSVSAASLQDLKDFITIFLRKAERRASAPQP